MLHPSNVYGSHMTEARKTDPALTHLDRRGQAQMVDVGDKTVTRRIATARTVCVMSPATRSRIEAGDVGKGEVLAVARIAAIQAAKRTDELIPLCHSLPLERVTIEFRWINDGELEIEATVATEAKTGVEMEAMVAASVAGLTIYDMCKAIDRELSLSCIELIRKSGGRSGTFERGSP